MPQKKHLLYYRAAHFLIAITVFFPGIIFSYNLAPFLLSSFSEVYVTSSDTSSSKKISQAGMFFYDPPIRKQDDQKRWFLRFTPGFKLLSGNTDLITLKGELGLTFDDGITEYSNNISVSYSRVNKELAVNNGHLLLKYDRYIYKRWEFFVFSKFEYDIVAELSIRNNSGAGVKFVAFNNKYWRTDISLAPVFQYERYEQIEKDIDARFSLRYRLQLTPVESLHLSATLFYIPNIANFSDYRIELSTPLKTKLISFSRSGHLSLVVGYLLRYNSFVPVDVENLNQETTVGFELQI